MIGQRQEHGVDGRVFQQGMGVAVGGRLGNVCSAALQRAGIGVADARIATWSAWARSAATCRLPAMLPMPIMPTWIFSLLIGPAIYRTPAADSSPSATPRTTNPTARAADPNCPSWVRNSSTWRLRRSWTASALVR